MESITRRRPSHWWVFLIRGLVFIILGIYMICSPANSFAALGFLFGLIIFFTGLLELLRTVRDRDQASRAWHLLLGIIDVILGIILLGHIGTSEAILRIIVGIWVLFSGFSMLSFSRFTGRSLVLTIGGGLIILFGLMIIFNSAFGTITIALITAVAFIVTGIFNALLAYRLKKA
jgi:uncharacterized membrane protein HdeD (DUF308 family)